MYPLLLHSPCKSTLWGGNKIYEMLKDPEYGNASELCLLACTEKGGSTVKNRELKDINLIDVFNKYGKSFGGKKFDNNSAFPFAVKLIDAKDSLPLGVSTRERIIYVSEAEEGAQIIYGFLRDADPFEVKRRIDTKTLFSLCNFINVKNGDIINIPAGLMHAIGKGIMCYEIDHGDEEFYPISDYGRTDTLGNRMELKPEAAMKILTLKKAPLFAAKLEDTFLYPFGTVSELPSDEGLSVSLVRLAGSVGITESESFVSVVITSGNVMLSYASGNMHLKTGDSIILPAKLSAKFTGYADLLCSHL